MKFTAYEQISYAEAIKLLSEAYIGFSTTTRRQIYEQAKENGYIHVDGDYYDIVGIVPEDFSKGPKAQVFQLSLPM